MNICVIGCGYVGSSAAKMWKQQGHNVTVTTRSIERAYHLRAIADLVYVLSDDYHDLLEKQDVVLVSVAPTDNDYVETYIGTAEKLALGLNHSSVKQIIYTSSTSVYGDTNGAIVDENTPLRPANDRAQILTTTEQKLLNLKSDRRNVCIFRLGEVYGPGREIEERLKKIQGRTIPGNGQNITNLSRLDEILLGLDIAVKQQLDGVFNLCNDIHITRKELYTQLCQKENISMPVWDPSTKGSHGGNKIVCNKKIKATGWHPFHTL